MCRQAWAELGQAQQAWVEINLASMGWDSVTKNSFFRDKGSCKL